MYLNQKATQYTVARIAGNFRGGGGGGEAMFVVFVVKYFTHEWSDHSPPLPAVQAATTKLYPTNWLNIVQPRMF